MHMRILMLHCVLCCALQSIVCPECSSAVYCSQGCLRKDDVHGVMCSKLRSERLVSWVVFNAGVNLLAHSSYDCTATGVC